jgi:Fe2+ or Zn2+ uptake regulation protein
MAATPSPLARRPTKLRERIYRLLLRQPSRAWTIQQITDALAAGGGASVDTVRAVLYVLLADNIMATQAGQRTMTLRLTTDGIPALHAIMTTWSTRSTPKQPTRLT